MVQLSATRCSCIAILWVSLVSFASITLCVTSQLEITKVSVYFVIDSVRKLLDTRSYSYYGILISQKQQIIPKLLTHTHTSWKRCTDLFNSWTWSCGTIKMMKTLYRKLLVKYKIVLFLIYARGSENNLHCSMESVFFFNSADLSFQQMFKHSVIIFWRKFMGSLGWNLNTVVTL
jgi:hypothetical protein